MMSTTPEKLAATRVVPCESCGTKNRVAAAARGRPQCARCHSALAWVVDADDATFGQFADAASLPVLVDMWAPWCGPCRQVSPVLEQLAREYAGRLKLVKVNSDVSPSTSSRFEVQAIPTLLLMKGGAVLARQVGAAPVSTLRAWVKQALPEG
jgi:thioredoxin 2